MSTALFLVGIILIIGWAFAFLVFHLTGLIHILPAIGLIALVIRLFYNRSFMKFRKKSKTLKFNN